ncbi:MAG: hypothetical protein AB8B74_08295 [Crocinitomicaceae bacterium]
MKKYFVLALIVGLTLMSCNKKGCIDVLASNFDKEANTDDGTCTYSQDQYIGTYSVPDACGFASYTITISEGPTKGTIIINNFEGEDGVNIKATIDGNEFSFSDIHNGVGFVGTGYIVDTAVTIDYFACEDYNYPDNCTEFSCSIKLTRQ